MRFRLWRCEKLCNVERSQGGLSVGFLYDWMVWICFLKGGEKKKEKRKKKTKNRPNKEEGKICKRPNGRQETIPNYLFSGLELTSAQFTHIASRLS